MPNIIEITDLSAPELDIYARYSEPQLLHYFEPHGGIFIAESPGVIGLALDAGYEPISMLTELREDIANARESIMSIIPFITLYKYLLQVLLAGSFAD